MCIYVYIYIQIHIIFTAQALLVFLSLLLSHCWWRREEPALSFPSPSLPLIPPPASPLPSSHPIESLLLEAQKSFTLLGAYRPRV